MTGNDTASYVERIERVQDERDTLAQDLKALYEEAKGEGVDTKVLRALVAARRKGFEEYRELHDAVIEQQEQISD